ncbi:hypothetical protein NK8_04660 [Caballeronia sp. NK8]|uniref:hypothetical protein n=1 Tax=Caballeronia sp. NK8 TaxID=140098 RepID=UPI001BB6A1E4|nr:hypothetical protein [Caballeronia sp. NK8]BCQ22357.1 hypothetical protein NK8_04660 [Caballeronia sp. NK8]
MTSTELTEIPSRELVHLLDWMVWEMNHRGREDVLMWRKELLARSDAESTDVTRAIAVCDDYLAPEGSEEAWLAQAKAWPDLKP